MSDAAISTSAAGLGAPSVATRYRETAASRPARPAPGLTQSLDELSLAGPGNQALAETIDSLGAAGLLARRRAVRRLSQDDGVTFGGSTPEGPAQPWQVDPLPLMVEAHRWSALEDALQQRARLLDALLADLYGPRRTLRQGIVPADLVLGHRGFLPAADKVFLPTRRQLLLTATDLAHTGPDEWTVLSDRVQAPSGAGYAMANRRLVARTLDGLHRRTPLRRLRPFFEVMQLSLEQAAHAGSEVPRVVLLSPGPGSESAYDQAQLATLLGHPLAQSDDLVMADGRLWLRTTGRLQPVDVLLRRVDAAWCDSLDLRSDSRLGVPGLVAAARRGAVSIANPLGAGVLENPGLAPYWDALGTFLLGEEPVLHHAETWWCGDDAARSHVLANLAELVVKPISRGVGFRAMLGWQLSAAERDELRARITEQPWAWTGQRPVAGSTAPLVTPPTSGRAADPESCLVPSHLSLRTFGVALGDGYHFMPGGLARVAGDPDQLVISNHAGALAKDVWVLEDESVAVPAPLDLAARRRGRGSRTEAPTPGLTPRGASNLYWMGRYAERTEATARLVLVGDNLAEDHLYQPSSDGHHAMLGMLEAISAITGTASGFLGEGAAQRLGQPVVHLRELLVDAELSSSVAWTAHRTVLAMADVRELISGDTTGVVSRLQRTLDKARDRGDQVDIQPVAARVLESCLALSGLAAESLVHDPIWAFTEAGRRVERAQVLLRLLRHTLAIVRPPRIEQMVLEAVLRSGDSVITFRRRQAAGAGSEEPLVDGLQLMLTDPSNPRSVLNQLPRLTDALALVPSAQLTQQLREVIARVRQADLAELAAGDRSGLAALLVDLDERMRTLSDTIEAVHFVQQAPQQSFAVAELSDLDTTPGSPR